MRKLLEDTPENIEKIRKLYWDDELTMRVIAKTLGTQQTNISEFMSRNNIPARKHTKKSYSLPPKKEDFSKIIEAYNIDGLSVNKVADKFDTSSNYIRKVLNNIRTAGESIKLNNTNNITTITYLQKQLILGSLLGDGSISLIDRKDYKSYIFQVDHCLDQKEYAIHKSNILDVNLINYIQSENSFSAGNVFFKTSYQNKYELEKIYNLCTVNGKKTVNQNWLDQLDPIAIAYWYMDDGSSSYSRNNKCVVTTFATNSFPEEQCVLLQNKLISYGIETTIHYKKGRINLDIERIINVRVNSINKLMDLIEPYIIDCMKYKIKRKTSKTMEDY